MAVSDDLINFDLIETHKENIQSLPGGRSAKHLVSTLSPFPSGGALTAHSNDTKTLNDAIRHEYEIELQSIADSDDPLDIYDRYVKWTLNAYPSAQATPQSQLLPLLERATKSFLTSQHYKNDSRYLKLWLHYIRLFSDSPRETFAFLARHNIGEGLATFYEEFAAWLEGAGRWKQAEEVYMLGIDREARPAERLMRKYNQFKQRFETRSADINEPSSPALPKVRAALATKIDPFATTARSDSPQASQQPSTTMTSKPKKAKMAIFSDTDNESPPTSSAGPTNGWDNIGSVRDRKKENTVEARPWAGETLKAGKRVGTVPKMEIFKDTTLRENQARNSPRTSSSAVVNPRTGRSERTFVDIDSIYPNEKEEYSFEELRAMKRGWAQREWRTQTKTPLQPCKANASPARVQKSAESIDVENLTHHFEKADIRDIQAPSTFEDVGQKPAREKRKKVREVKQETQTVKTRLDSPSGRKLKRKGSTEPTMTLNSKAAMNEIYDMFNQASRTKAKEDTQSGDDTDFGDDTYSTAGESTGTGRISATTSEYGDDTMANFPENTSSQPDSVSPWSDFTASKHVPKVKHNHKHANSEDFESSQTGVMDEGFDTQAIAAIANQDFDELDTKMIANLAGDVTEDQEEMEEEGTPEDNANNQELKTPVEAEDSEYVEVQDKPRYVPLPPDGYEPTPVRPYRDPSSLAQNMLPFMTPIVERTESSIASSTAYYEKDYFNSKTPSRSAFESPSKLKVDTLQLESPCKESPSPAKRKLHEVVAVEEDLESISLEKKVATHSESVHSKVTTLVQPLSAVEVTDVFKKPALPAKLQTPTSNGPVIQDLQCNPCDTAIRQQILDSIIPSLSSYSGYNEHLDQRYGCYPQLKSYADKISKQAKAKSSPRKAEKTLTKAVPPMLKFRDSSRIYAVRRELGKGAFAPVYLADSYDQTCEPEADKEISVSTRSDLEAIKTESPSTTLTWEFYVLRLLRSRFEPASRTIASIITAHEHHSFADEAYLIIDYHSQGTLLDLINLVRTENQRSGKPAEALDETLAMWFTIELLRTVSHIHSVGILHGDLKADNCLVRFTRNIDLTEPFHPNGKHNWSSKGLMLIDFGRGIDMRSFRPDVQFIADWEASTQDCPEIKECRPWTWQIDYHGIANVVHTMLFGKYIETVPVGNTGSGLGGKKEWKLKEGLKRYWEKDLWCELFNVLLNPGSVEGEAMPLQKSLKKVMHRMEEWVAREGEKGGRDLRAKIRQAERLVGARK